MTTETVSSTLNLSSEELEITEHEIDMILLENQIKDDKLRSHNWFIKLLKKIFRGNL